MPKQTIDVEVPEGWKAVRVGLPRAGEFYLSPTDGCPIGTHFNFQKESYIIVEREAKYRNVTAADVGREVEVSDDNKTWRKEVLLAVLPENKRSRFITDPPRDAEGHNWHRFARIIDDGPAKEKPREWWLCLSSGGSWWVYDCMQVTDCEQVHVREVTE